MKKSSAPNQPFLRFALLVYCALMLWLLFGRPSSQNYGMSYQQMLQLNMNLTPFYTIRNYLYVIIYRTNDAVLLHCIVNLLGNVFLFIPAGWLLPKLFPRMRNFFLFFITCAGIIFLAELTQLFTLLGSFDVDDLILNLFGMTLGYLIRVISKTDRTS